MTRPRNKKPLASTSAAANAATATSDNSDSEFEVETPLEFDEGKRKKSLNAVVSSIKDGTEINIQEGFRAIILTLIGLNTTELTKKVTALEEKTDVIEDKVENIEDSVNQISEEVKSLQRSLKSLEIEAFQCKYIIRNLPLNLKDKETKESNDSTLEVVKNLLNVVGLKLNCIDEAFRFYPKDFKPTANTKGKQNAPTLFVKFCNRTSVNIFKRKLPILRETPRYETIQVDRVIPPCLLDDYNIGKDVAYAYRKKEQHKTRFDIQKGELVLLTKANGEKDFTSKPYKNLKKRKSSIISS